MRLSRKLTALSIALVVCGSAACTDLEGNWSLLSFTIYPPNGAPVEMRGAGTLWFDDFGYVMMTLDADAASAALLTEAGVPMQKNRFFTWGKVVVDRRNKTLTYVRYISEGRYPAVTARPMAVERLFYWNVTGGTLTLTTKDESGRPLSIGRWRRQFTIAPGRGYGEPVGLLLDGGASHLAGHAHVGDLQSWPPVPRRGGVTVRETRGQRMANRMSRACLPPASWASTVSR